MSAIEKNNTTTTSRHSRAGGNPVQLITDNINIWSSATQTRKGVGRGSSKKLNLYGIKKLRELILELAVCGLLVPQDPNDEPASVLLKKITAEKEKLIKENKIKKQKALPSINEDEKKYIIPKGWEWVQNSELFILKKGKMPQNLSENNIGWPYLDIDALDRHNIKRYTDDEKCPRSTNDDILVVCDGSRSGLVLDGKLGVVGSTLAIIETPKFIQEYIKLFFKQSFQRLNSSMKGAAIPHLDTKKLRTGILGLPPLGEQHRIVTKVDELMALCDQLEQQQESSITAHKTLVETLLSALTNAADKGAFDQAWGKIANHFDTLFTTEHSIDQLKQTILQLAVMGKLVPQNSNDEPATILLEKIAVEKERLIKEKKIKKQKGLPEITDEEKLFKLPNGWEWCRLGKLGYDLGGGTPSKSKPEYWGGDIPWVSPKDMKIDYISQAQDLITDIAMEKSSAKYIPAGSLLMVVRGMILAHSFPVAITSVPVAINQDMKALVFSEIDKNFLLLMMKSLKQEVVGMVDRSSHGTCKLMSEKLWNKVIIIPPLKEQFRIVKKIDELMALCDEIKISLSEIQKTQLKLVDTISKRVINNI